VTILLEVLESPGELRDAFHRYDGFLLDIYMPNSTPGGWTLAQRLREVNSHAPIVFITSSDSYVLPAFDLQYVIGYVKKPLSEERLFHALDNLLEYMTNLADEFFMHRATFVDINDDRYSATFKVAYREILFFRSDKGSNYLLINDSSEPRFRITIKELVATLPAYFAQIDKTTIVNLKRVYQMRSNSLLLNDSIRTELPISRSHRKSVIEAYHDLRFTRFSN